MNLYKPNYNEYAEGEEFRIKEVAQTGTIVKVYSGLINRQLTRNEWVN